MLLVALVVSVLPPVATQLTETQLCADAPSGIFSNTHGNTHPAAIDCVAWYGIARGSGDGTYLPRASVRRDQMATFLLLAVALLDGVEAVPGRRLSFSACAPRIARWSIPGPEPRR